MCASRRFSYWPGLSVWHHYEAHSTCNAPSALPKNPFSRRSDAEIVVAEAQYTEDYHIFQLSCYTQSPTMMEAVKTAAATAATAAAAAAGNNACRRETAPSPMSRVRSLLLVPFSLMETAKTRTQTMRSNTSSVVDQHLDGIRECGYGSTIENDGEPAYHRGCPAPRRSFRLVEEYKLTGSYRCVAQHGFIQTSSLEKSARSSRDHG
ncbi:hypothetical protein CTA1_1527 [Colletotrichum tanaceti]|uniref:Uncharacterized protein n=1 Tax=Colletotrichum tanaceti TaxID=1306861 RepID=A0A4U6X690_9PEZI|nr:hypothetical protein CTA1_1527 [Colletotrichum tanaceti]